ncbi:D-alanyl-glycyl endopeptidase-like protein, putative [Trypanosoma cruzi marinkellei]|uniref:D-alanyl-glycyl endopeptidase-like protein, putative n=1 Tax=Trypanosoma cruzi marinkellei TaxID=85056 RepID=K2MZE6_TRYCR|nr:D-alanyl-glycyl endopeptidase-like protein, putative [Trypanosoma cruzi marinkellei]
MSHAFVALDHPHDVRPEPFLLGILRSRSTGTRWLAAEFITRTYYLHRGMSFTYDGLDASEYWSALRFYGAMVTEREYETLELLNSAEATTAKERKRLAPRVFDVVVWSPMGEHDLPEGHVAVVVQVEDDVEAAGGEDRLRELRNLRLQPRLLYIAEQNFDNTHWGDKNYSRVLRFQWQNGKEAVLQDPLGLPIIGWVRPGKPKQNTDVEDDL